MPGRADDEDAEGDGDGHEAEVDVEDASDLASRAGDATAAQETIVPRPNLVQSHHCYYYRRLPENHLGTHL